MSGKTQLVDTGMLDSRKILVVDDDENIRDLCSEVLRVAGYQVDTARHGLEGLERLRNSGFRYDLVVSDMNMPGLGGMEFYRAALENSPGLREKFLFVTGNPDWAFGRVADAGLSCLPKPFRISEFLERVEKLMEKSLMGAPGSGGGKRAEGRIDTALDCRITACGAELAARTVDISPHGVKVEYPGGDLLETGAVIGLSLGIGRGFETGRKAVVAWSAQAGGSILSGLRLDEPVPVSSLVNAAARQAGPEAREFRPGNALPQKHL
ncbi:MAG: response regulator [Thermodesulfobacteriota bacterium]|nr:MAG: response regulator [Thermodesulfobacteriota bacterium]